MKKILIIIFIILILLIGYSIVKNNNALDGGQGYEYVDTEPMETFVPEEPSYLQQAEEAESESFRPSISVEQLQQEDSQ